MKRNIETILRGAHYFDWSLQGFGMFRLYLSDGVRLHVWDSAAAVPGVSMVHDHPWDLRSEVVAGLMRNRIYGLADDLAPGRGGAKAEPWYVTRIQPGAGAKVLTGATAVELRLVSDMTYAEGQTYRQAAAVIHESLPVDGTVTIATRENRRAADVALSFHKGPEWVSAEPRPATDQEVRAMASGALGRWFR